MALSYREMDETLMRELRLYHHPVAVRFLFSDEEVEEFKAKAPAYCTPLKPQTFCQWEVGARMRGKTVLGTVDKLFCTNAQCSFGWHDIDEGEETLVLATCNKMTRELKLCKVYVDPSFKHASSSFEFYYANDEALELNLRQSLNILGKVKTLFRQNMEMLGQDCEE